MRCNRARFAALATTGGLALLGSIAGLVVAEGAAAHSNGSPYCHGTFVNDGHGEGRCEAPFKGFPIGVTGTYDPEDATAPGEIHVELHAKLADGSERPLGLECQRSKKGAVSCEKETNPLRAPVAAPMPAPEEIVSLVCRSHSHAPVKPGTTPVATFGCWSTDAGREALKADMACAEAACDEPAPGPSGGLPALPATPAGLSSVVAAVPINTYSPGPVVVDRSTGLRFANFDLNRHDVVAFDAKRPDGSAEWCADFEPGQCPLFWSPLIEGGGSQTPVRGLEDAEAGGSYTFFCSIHPSMKGKIEVVR